MAGVIVVFPKSDDAKSIRNLLVRNGYDVAAVCTSGAQALSAADRIGSGVVVCGYKYPDMLYEELYENVMPSFAMLLLAPASYHLVNGLRACRLIDAFFLLFHPL